MTEQQGTSRRRFLGGAAAAGVGLAAGVGVAAGYGLRSANDPEQTTADPYQASTDPDARANAVVPFYGAQQAGVTTTQQERLMFAALDVTTTDVEQLQRMLGRWAAIAARLTAGKQVSDSPVRDEQPPFDTGESMDLGPHSLTITVGFGPSLFDDRFGLTAKMPAELTPFGIIPGDAVMKPAHLRRRSVHPGLRRRSAGRFPRRPQPGQGGPGDRGAEVVPARLRPGIGHRCGPDDAAQPDGVQGRHPQHPRRRHRGAARSRCGYPAPPQSWMANGTYLVARKIRMEIESWDTDPLTDQERIFARNKATGAPITGGDEFSPVDYAKTDEAGDLVVDINAHIRLSAPEQNGGIKLLRRGYNYTDGQDPDTGKLAAGLFFIAFQRDPQAQFKVLQTRLGKSDLLNEYIAHIGGGLWACPPGVSGPGDWFGKALFSS